MCNWGGLNEETGKPCTHVDQDDPVVSHTNQEEAPFKHDTPSSLWGLMVWQLARSRTPTSASQNQSDHSPLGDIFYIRFCECAGRWFFLGAYPGGRVILVILK